MLNNIKLKMSFQPGSAKDSLLEICNNPFNVSTLNVPFYICHAFATACFLGNNSVFYYQNFIEIMKRSKVIKMLSACHFYF